MALSQQEWRALFAALALLPLVALVLWVSGYNRTQKMMNWFLVTNGFQEIQTETKRLEARCIARMVSIAARYGIYRANCLKQSLVLWWLLARRGIESEIRIGVQKEQGETLNAHAWVECCGQPISDQKDFHKKFRTFEASEDQ